MKKILQLFCGSIFILSCGKDQTTYTPISDQKLRDAVTVKQGSYFIYQDSASHQEDSFYVKSFVHSDQTGAEHNVAEVMEYVCENMSQTTIGVSAQNNNISGVYYDADHYGFRCCRFPFAQGYEINTSELKVNIIAYYSSFTIAGVPYKDVYEAEWLSYLPGKTQTAYISRVWFSMETGLIKIKLTRDSYLKILELKRFKIIR